MGHTSQPRPLRPPGRPGHAPRRLGWARHSPGQPPHLGPAPPPAPSASPVLWATVLLGPTAPPPSQKGCRGPIQQLQVGGQRSVQGPGDSSTAKSHSGLEEGPRLLLRLPGSPVPSREPPCASRTAEATPFHLPSARRRGAEPGACALPGGELQQLRETAGSTQAAGPVCHPHTRGRGWGKRGDTRAGLAGCPTAHLAPRCPAPAAAVSSPLPAASARASAESWLLTAVPQPLGWGPGENGSSHTQMAPCLFRASNHGSAEKRGLPVC